MKVLLVNGFYPPRATGSAHLAEELALQYVRSGHEVLVLTTSVPGAPATEVREGVRIVRLAAVELRPGDLAFNYSLPFVARLGAVRRVRRLVREFRPDVVHQHGQFFDLTFVTTWVAWRLGIPRVLTVHTPLVHTSRSRRRFIELVDRTVIRALNSPGRPVVVGVDRFVCELAADRYRPRRGPVRFIPATVDTARFAGGDGDAIRRRHGLGDRPVILSLGHVIPIRSRVPLVQALPRIIAEVPDVVVVVVGAVYDREFLRVAESLGVRDHVVVVGPVPHAEVIDHLAAATVETHDLDGHTLSLASLEVMAAGVPLFARVRRDVFPGIDLDDHPALRVIPDAGIDEIAASLVGLLTSPAARAAVVDEQRDLVTSNFDVRVIAEQYLALFAELIADVPGEQLPPSAHHALRRQRGPREAA